jgi:hypothetical protein
MDSVPSLSPHQYSHIPCRITLDSALPCSHNTLPLTRHYDALGMPTDSLPGGQDLSLMTSGSRMPYQPSFPYPRRLTALFWLYWTTTALSAELNTDDPDPTPTLCLARLHCTAFSYRAMPLQYQSFSRIPGMLPRQTRLTILRSIILRSWREFSVGGILHGLTRGSAAKWRCRTPGVWFTFSVSQ